MTDYEPHRQDTDASANGTSHRDKDTLERLLIEEDLDAESAAERLDCSRTSIVRWANRHNIGQHECPTCGEFFLSHDGASLHHAREHGESFREREERNRDDWHDCPNCDRSLPTRQGLGSHHKAKHGMGIKEWERQQLDFDHECPTCGEGFETEVGLGLHHTQKHGESIREYRRHQCDYDHNCPTCGKGFETLHGVWVHHGWMHGGPVVPKIELECAHCGDSFEVRPSHARQREYCSRPCVHLLPGREEPIHRDYGEGWNRETKETVRERAERVCDGCGMDEETHLQEYGCRLHIHHKTPSRSFENAEQGNTLKNLVALCAACHQVAEAMAPLYPFAD